MHQKALLFRCHFPFLLIAFDVTCFVATRRSFNWPVRESLLDGNKKNKKLICAVTIPFQKHINCVHVRETLCNVFFFSLPRMIRFYFQMLYLSKYTQQPPQSSFCIQLKSKLLCHELLLACKLNIVSVIISLL